MSKLTDVQLALLSKASQREDRALEVPTPHTVRTVKQLEALTKRGLIQDVPSEGVMPVWCRAEETNEPRSLIITDLGLIAIGIVAATIPDAMADQKPAPTSKKTAAKETAPGGKTAAVVKLLQRREGASIAALIDATGWLPHSTRAALTGLRKKGYEIERGKAKDKATTIYRIVKAPADKAA